MKKKHSVLLSLAALIVVFCLWYTRPRPLERYCPPLEITECTEIKFFVRTQRGTTKEDGSYWPYTESGELVFTPGEPEVERLIELVDGRRFSTRLANLLPKGTRTYRTEPGDVTWDMFFCFENVTLSEGGTGSGYMLHLHNFYGKLDVSYELETVYITTTDKDAWLAEINGIIAEG